MFRSLSAAAACVLAAGAVTAAPPDALPPAAPPPAARSAPAAAPATPFATPDTFDPTASLCGPATAAACCKTGCGPAYRFWAEADVLLWFVHGAPLPPLVTAAPAGTARPSAGALGQPGTAILEGGSRDGYGLIPGGRLRVGYWLDDDRLFGLEGNFFFLGRSSNNAAFAGSGGAAGTGAGGDGLILARPYTNAVTGLPDSELVSFPGVLSGSVAVRDTVGFLGGGVNLRCNLCCDCAGRLDLLTGYQVLSLSESLSVTENLTNLGTAQGVPPGTNIVVQDRIRTRNVFNGGLLGLNYERWAGRWSADVRGSVALGDVHRTVDIEGQTTVTVPGQPPVTSPGGLLALPSNIGRRTSDMFGVAPQVGFNLGYQVASNVRILAGYTFIYLNNVARPGDVIDTVIDPRQLPPATAAGVRPAPTVKNTDFWAQGVNLGLQVRY